MENALGEEAAFFWHESRDLEGSDVVILPGGFAYGDYLRTGAIARFAPIMSAVKEFADQALFYAFETWRPKRANESDFDGFFSTRFLYGVSIADNFHEKMPGVIDVLRKRGLVTE